MFKKLFSVFKVVYHVVLGGKNITVHIAGKDVTVQLPPDIEG